MWHNHIIPFFVENPSMAIFLTLGLGYLLGKLKYKMLALGTVTSVLLVGVSVGILMPDIKILPPLKTVFFLLFLFAIGYSVGPQFFRSFRKTGLPQVFFAVLMCAVCLGATWLCGKLAGYNAGEAAGLFAGAQTMSAVIGVGQETINGLNIPEAAKTSMNNVIPVMYAVTYVFGTAGSAWISSFLILLFLSLYKLYDALPERFHRNSGMTTASFSEKINRGDVQRLSWAEAALLSLVLSVDSITAGLGSQMPPLPTAAVVLLSSSIHFFAMLAGLFAGNLLVQRFSCNFSWVSTALFFLLALSRIF